MKLMIQLFLIAVLPSWFCFMWSLVLKEIKGIFTTHMVVFLNLVQYFSTVDLCYSASVRNTSFSTGVTDTLF